jgi:hypothetical protein
MGNIRGSNLLHQVVHEGLQRYVVCENCLSSGGSYTTIWASGVCSRWVELGQEESSLRTTGIANNKSRKRKAVSEEILDGLVTD